MRKKRTNTYAEKDLKKWALDALQANPNITGKDELWDAAGYSKSTAFNHGISKDEDVIEALRKNRTRKKALLRKKWEDSSNAILQLALYKLLADDDELDRLNGNSRGDEPEMDLPPLNVTILGKDDKLSDIQSRENNTE